MKKGRIMFLTASEKALSIAPCVNRQSLMILMTDQQANLLPFFTCL